MKAASDQIIQSLWVGESLSPMEVMCINSYRQQGHEFHLYVYQQVDNVPSGTVLLDANVIIPFEQVFVDAFGGFVNFSNLFRYTLLFLKGGWWVDMDTVCLKTFDFKQPYVFSSEFSDPYERYLVNTTFIKSPAQSPLMGDCMNFLKARGHQHIHWGELGVNLISRMIFRNGLQRNIQPAVTFCPVSAYRVNLLIGDLPVEIPDKSYAIHWWHEVWKRNGIDKRNTFGPRSHYEVLKLNFG